MTRKRKKRTSVFVKPENIIISPLILKRRINNKRMATLVASNKNKLVSPLLCIRIKRKFYLLDGNERLKNILALNKTGMEITRIKVDLL